MSSIYYKSKASENNGVLATVIIIILLIAVGAFLLIPRKIPMMLTFKAGDERVKLPSMLLRNYSSKTIKVKTKYVFDNGGSMSWDDEREIQPGTTYKETLGLPGFRPVTKIIVSSSGFSSIEAGVHYIVAGASDVNINDKWLQLNEMESMIDKEKWSSNDFVQIVTASVSYIPRSCSQEICDILHAHGISNITIEITK